MRLRSLVLLLCLLAACTNSSKATPHPTPTSLSGTIGAAQYEIDVPAAWNGDLLLFSHGYVAPGSPNGVQAAPTVDARTWLASHGYAMAGSSYSSTGWAHSGSSCRRPWRPVCMRSLSSAWAKSSSDSSAATMLFSEL